MYGKFFAHAFGGSLYGAGPITFAVLGYIISHARDDEVEINPRELASKIGKCTPEEIEEVLATFQQPDPESRSDLEEGRRLIQTGRYLYRVVNHRKYREMKDDDSRREYMRDYMRKYRAKQSTEEAEQACEEADQPIYDSNVNINVNSGKASFTHTEAETEAEAEAEEKAGAHSDASRPVRPPRVKRKALLQADAVPNEADLDAAQAAGLSRTDCEAEWLKFRTYHCGKEIDISSRWREWLKRCVTYQAERTKIDQAAVFSGARSPDPPAPVQTDEDLRRSAFEAMREDVTQFELRDSFDHIPPRQSEREAWELRVRAALSRIHGDVERRIRVWGELLQEFGQQAPDQEEMWQGDASCESPSESLSPGFDDSGS